MRPLPVGSNRDTAGVYVIAEASGNHSGSLQTAIELVHAAAGAGADAIKFQTFTPEEIAAEGVTVLRGHDAHHDAWLERLFPGQTPVTLRALLGKGGLPRVWHAPLKQEADACGIGFLSTPFSVDAARFLVEEVGVPALKIASGDLTFTPLLEYADRTGLPLLISTGGATFDEVAHVVYELSWAQLSLLHCVSAYPCPIEAANLRAIGTLQTAFPWLTLGWSDHTTSLAVPALAVACGALIIEKHLRLPVLGQTTDTDHSITPAQFARMVEHIRDAEAALGTGQKAPHALEMHDRLWARRDPSDWLRPCDAARAGQWA